MNRAVLYLRSSKDRHDVSLDAQRRQLHELAAAQNLAIVGEYCDEVESAKDDDRPGLQRLYRDLRGRHRAWNHILLLDTSRLARRMDIALAFEEGDCAPRGVKVVYKSVPDIDPVFRLFFKRQLQATDELHSMMSKAKGLAGMRENVHQGWRAGGRAPTGYRLVHVERGKIRDGAPVTKSRLELGPDGAKMGLYLRDRAAGVARDTAAKRAGLELAVTTLIGIERNALTYAGHTVWNVHNERVRGGYVGGMKRRPRAEWTIKDDTHPAVITTDEAERILAMHEAQSRRRARTARRVYLLAGLLVAPDGSAWHGDSGNYRMGKGRKIEATRLERAIVEQLGCDLQDDKLVEEVTARVRRLYRDDVDATELRRIDREIAEASKRIARVSDLLAQTTAPEALLRSIEKWESERTELLNRKIELDDRAKVAGRMRHFTEADARRLLAHMARDLEEEREPQGLKETIAGFLESIVLDPVSYACTMRYKLDPLKRGDKVASPRECELIPRIIFERTVRIEPNRRGRPPTRKIERIPA